MAGIDLREFRLMGADLTGAYLTRAYLIGANLTSACLPFAHLIGADLTAAYLPFADLTRANLTRANFTGTIMSPSQREQLLESGVKHLDKSDEETKSTTSMLHTRIMEEPLTPYNLTTIISALTELSTKFWLITEGRFADLIEYTQTRDIRFAEETGLVITKITHNSPLDAILSSLNLDPKKFADALVTTIDGISQRKAKLEQAQLENQARAQAIKLAEQKAEQEQKNAALEHQRQALEIERQRLELLEQQLDLQKKGMEYALQLAKEAVDLLTNVDDATKGMIIQAILPNILQLQNGKGLIPALPEPNKEV